MLPGRGVRARVEGRQILAGNRELLNEHGVSMEASSCGGRLPPEGLYRDLSGGWTAVFAGYIVLSDTLREESAGYDTAPSRTLGVQPVLLTGDHENAARTIAGQAAHRGGTGQLPAGGQAEGYRPVPGQRPAGVHDRRRHQRRPGPEKGRMWASPWAAWAATSP